ncbi:TIR domain-containing protein [Halomonas sp. H10-59]|uniref:TIR domain-containing protein n=1 Tax=Halomonas sp. H10-59 TaxID=2950874 RepID=A0AAU7KT40_9GAMM
MADFGYPPLTISFVWHPSDFEHVEPILEAIQSSFARNKNKPFSRGLNIPLFYFSSKNANETPADSPKLLAQNNIIFVFTSVNTSGYDGWREYVENLPSSSEFKIVPIAITRDGLSHGGALNKKNCVRVYEWPLNDRDLHAIVCLAHEIYRYGCLPNKKENVGKDSSITIFLSHAKAGDTGRLHSEEISRFIDNTNMNRFFDSTEISPGFDFDNELEEGVKDSTLVAIESDAYSSRYWCQREILCAKKNNRPIVVVNSLDDYEDRIFPAASNVPCVHVSPESPISRRDILRILSAAILETIRYSYTMQCLRFYKKNGWIASDCELSARPPEIRQVLMAKSRGQKKICYPEPPIYSDEADWHDHLGIEAFTPLWNLSEQDLFAKLRIGVSVSDVQGDGFTKNHIHSDHLIRFSQDIAKHLLARSATLIYGGDLKSDGFTAFILNEAAILHDRIGAAVPMVENHLAWPLYVSEPEIVAWRAKYSQVMRTVEYEIPDDISPSPDKNVFLSPESPQSSYIWSRSLSKMRYESIKSSTVRICAGGRLQGYKGKMPGVLEEISISIAEEKPIYLLGAFGGVVGDVCEFILSGNVPDTLTEEWQKFHNEGYAELQHYASSYGHQCDYDQVLKSIQACSLSVLAKRSGLDEDDYKKLMVSPFIDECVHIIIKGLKSL